MIKDNFKVIGVMSGTSLDGVDLVYVHLNWNAGWKYKIIAAETQPYPLSWITILKHLVSRSIDDLKAIDKDYTRYLAEVIAGFIERHKIKTIDAVCSHGHTALHDPGKGFTYQIGNLPELAGLLQQTVVCDFRVQDVELGGQGAPLVPIGDALLFSDFTYCLNLGGFANISMEKNNARIAFDICPVNIVLNHYVNTIGLAYDDEGKLAASGTVNLDLLEDLNALPFYQLPYPKSLGLEWVMAQVFPLIDSFKLSLNDMLSTFVEHIAIQISLVLPKMSTARLLITGGGAYHTYLIHRLNAMTSCQIVIPSKEVIEYKEALVFGLLGVLKLRGEVNCLQSVTGAEKDHSSGVVYSTSK